MAYYDYSGTLTLGDERPTLARTFLAEGVTVTNITMGTPTTSSHTTPAIADLGPVGDDAVGTYQACYQVGGAGAVLYADFRIYKHGAGDYRAAAIEVAGTEDDATADTEVRASSESFIFSGSTFTDSKMHLVVVTSALNTDHSGAALNVGNFYIVDALDTNAKTWKIERLG